MRMLKSPLVVPPRFVSGHRFSDAGVLRN